MSLLSEKMPSRYLFSVSDYKGTLILDTPCYFFLEPKLGLMNPNVKHRLHGQRPSGSWGLMPDAGGLVRDAVMYNGPDQTNISQVSDPSDEKQNPSSPVPLADKADSNVQGCLRDTTEYLMADLFSSLITA